MKFDSLQFDYDDAGRLEILECVNSVIGRYLAGEKMTGLMLAPRAGKQSIIALVANEAKAIGVPFVHVITPWANLCYQVADDKKNQKTFDFYKARGTTEPFIADAIESIPHHKYYCSYKQPPTLIASTVQLMQANADICEAAIKHAKKTSGKAPIIMVDECQLMGLGRSWYSMMERLLNAGAYIVSMTGTERRLDKKPIIGFECRPVANTEEVTAHSQIREIKLNKKGEKVAEIVSGTMTTAEYEVMPIGSVPVPISRAFDKGWCEGMDVILFDFEVTDKGSGDKFKVSEMGAEKTRSNLVEWLQSEECIYTAVKAALNDLVRRRVELGLKDAKALFVTMSDTEGVKIKKNKAQDDGANYHARKIRQEFNRQYNDLPESIRRAMGRVNAEICTSMLSSGDPDLAAMEKLRRFALVEMDEDGIEPIDVIFVKNMGVVGLDVPELKTMANLSNNSAEAPTTLQANLRIATKWKESDVSAMLVLPAHYHGRQFRDMCGKWSNKIRISTFEEQSVSESVVKDRQKQDLAVVRGSGKIHSYNTHNGETIEDDMEDVVNAVRRKYKAANVLSHYQLVESIKQGAFPLTNEELQAGSALSHGNNQASGVTVSSMNQDRKKLKEEKPFGTIVKAYTNKLVHYGDDPDCWLSVNKRISNQAKALCGVNSQSTKDIVDPVVLQELREAVPDAYQIVKAEMVARGGVV